MTQHKAEIKNMKHIKNIGYTTCFFSFYLKVQLLFLLLYLFLIIAYYFIFLLRLCRLFCYAPGNSEHCVLGAHTVCNVNVFLVTHAAERSINKEIQVDPDCDETSSKLTLYPHHYRYVSGLSFI